MGIGGNCAVREVRDQVDWDEFDEVAVIGIDSEGARRVYTSSGDPRSWLWLARSLSLHVDDEINKAQRDV